MAMRRSAWVGLVLGASACTLIALRLVRAPGSDADRFEPVTGSRTAAGGAHRRTSGALLRFNEPVSATRQTSTNEIPEGGLTGPRWPGDPAWAAQLAVAAAGAQTLPENPGLITGSQAIWVAQSARSPAERRRALAWLGKHAPAAAFAVVAQIANHERDPDVRGEALAAVATLKGRFRPDELPASTLYPQDVLDAMTAAAAAQGP